MKFILNPEEARFFHNRRLELKLTQDELASKAHLSKRTVDNIEKARRTYFAETTIIRLCQVLDIR